MKNRILYYVSIIVFICLFLSYLIYAYIYALDNLFTLVKFNKNKNVNAVQINNDTFKIYSSIRTVKIK